MPPGIGESLLGQGIVGIFILLLVLAILGLWRAYQEEIKRHQETQKASKQEMVTILTDSLTVQTEVSKTLGALADKISVTESRSYRVQTRD